MKLHIKNLLPTLLLVVATAISSPSMAYGFLSHIASYAVGSVAAHEAERYIDHRSEHHDSNTQTNSSGSSWFSKSSSSGCADMYLDGQAPKIINKTLSSDTQAVCALGYVAMNSGISKTPLWSAEKLTRARVLSAEHMHRDGKFHEEESLPSDMRAELADYAHSGFDRGHMAPSGDMPDEDSQQQSFSLANMVPQNPNNNRGLWAGIEASVRNLAKNSDIYVVTGPLFNGKTVERIGRRVIVPTYLFKAVYDVRTKQAAAYLTPNAPGEAYRVISIDELNTMAGIDVFPALSESAKKVTMSLPEPKKITFKNN